MESDSRSLIQMAGSTRRHLDPQLRCRLHSSRVSPVQGSKLSTWSRRPKRSIGHPMVTVACASPSELRHPSCWSVPLSSFCSTPERPQRTGHSFTERRIPSGRRTRAYLPRPTPTGPKPTWLSKISKSGLRGNFPTIRSWNQIEERQAEDIGYRSDGRPRMAVQEIFQAVLPIHSRQC